MEILPMTKEEMQKNVCKKYNYYFADSETTTQKNYDREGKVRIVVAGYYHWGYNRSEKFECKTGLDLLKQIDSDNVKYKFEVKKIIKKANPKPILYFHNLKFDASFIRAELRAINPTVITPQDYRVQKPIINLLRSIGVRATSDRETLKSQIEKYKKTHGDLPLAMLNGSDYQLNNVDDLMKYLKLITWLIVDIVSNMGIIYACYIVTPRLQIIEMRDSMKLFPTDIATLGLEIGAPKLTGDWDYDKYRPLNYKMNKEEAGYFWRDIMIVAKVMSDFLRKHDDLKLTRTSYAKAELRESTEQYLKENYDNIYSDGGKSLEKIDDEHKLSLYDRTFPPTDIVTRELVKQAYSGGIVYVKKHKGRYLDVGEGLIADINSSYPAAMEYCDMPYGRGIYHEGKYKLTKERPFVILMFSCNFKLKEDTKDRTFVPMLKNEWGMSGDYVLSDKDLKPTRKIMTMSYIDFKLFLGEYDVKNIEYKGYVSYATVKTPFKRFAEKFAITKEKASKELNKAKMTGDTDGIKKWNGIKSENKRTGNSGYGGFAQNPLEEIVTIMTDYFGKGKNVTNGWEYRDTAMLEVAISVCSNGHANLMKGVHAMGGAFRYCDTDGVDGEGNIEELKEKLSKTISFSQYKLGDWKIEDTFKAGRYVRPKTYAIMVDYVDEDDGKTKQKIQVKFAGLNHDAKMLIEKLTDLKYTDEREPYKDVLVSRQVNGGTLIVKSEKKMTPRKVNLSSDNFDDIELKYYKQMRDNIKAKVDELNEILKSKQPRELKPLVIDENIPTKYVKRVSGNYGIINGYINMIIKNNNDLCKHWTFESLELSRYVQNTNKLYEDIEDVNNMYNNIK